MREKILLTFLKKEFFSFKGNVFKTKEEKAEENFINGSIIFIKEKSRDVNDNLFEKYFHFSTPIDLAKKII